MVRLFKAFVTCPAHKDQYRYTEEVPTHAWTWTKQDVADRLLGFVPVPAQYCACTEHMLGETSDMHVGWRVIFVHPTSSSTGRQRTEYCLNVYLLGTAS